MKHARRFAGTLCLASLMAATSASAHVVSDRDLRVVAQIPPAWGAGAAVAMRIDSTGATAPNRAGSWRHVVHQRVAMLVLVDASARADSARAERAWTALDAAFAQQIPDGSFRFDPAIGRGADLAGTAEWLASACRGLIATTNSPLLRRFQFRYALMKPKLQRALDAQLLRHDELMRVKGADAAVLLAEASAFLLADGLYHDERYGRAGQQALARALALQRKDGAFPSEPQITPESQARALIALQGVVIYFPSPTMERSAERAARWLKPKAKPKTKARSVAPASVDEVAFALQYAAIKPPAPLAADNH